MKLVADESVDFRIIKSLRNNGYEILSIQETKPGVKDVEVLKFANESEAILITEDKDFGELTFRLRKPNRGIILLRMSGMEISEKIKKILAVFENHIVELSDKFTVISSDKLRFRNIKNK